LTESNGFAGNTVNRGGRSLQSSCSELAFVQEVALFVHHFGMNVGNKNDNVKIFFRKNFFGPKKLLFFASEKVTFAINLHKQTYITASMKIGFVCQQ
jgi:hypothetical protein